MRPFSRQDELEQFKSQINLCDYALSLGYEVDTGQSSRGSVTIRNTIGDKLIVSRGLNRHWKYFNVHDDRDQGTIIDFIQFRDRCSLGEVRKRLRDWVGRSSFDAQPNYQSPELLPSVHDPQQVLNAWNRAIPISATQAYLHQERQIPSSILSAPIFQDRIRSDHRKNALFAHYNSTGICGYEIKNRGFTGFSPGGQKGFFCSRPQRDDKELIICETAIDLLSYATLFGTKQKRFISTAGQISPLQKSLLRRAADRMPTHSKIILAMDNDEAGRKLTQAIQEMLQSKNISSKRILRNLPTDDGADWNDILRASPNLKRNGFVNNLII